jgi:hypothetical protein
MAETRTLPNAVHFREFVDDPVTGHHYTATCGQTALASAMIAATPPLETTQQAVDLMAQMTREMMAKGWADSPNGNTTTKHLHDEAVARGFTIAQPYVEWQDTVNDVYLHNQLLAFAGFKPIVIMFTNAQALIAVDGSHTEAGLHGHFICVVGIEPRGYVCMDGDNSNIANQLAVYPWSVFPAAHPTGLLMLEMQTAASQDMDTLRAQLADTQAKLAAANASLAATQGQLTQSQALAAQLQAELDAAHTGGALEAIDAIRKLQAALKAIS